MKALAKKSWLVSEPKWWSVMCINSTRFSLKRYRLESIGLSYRDLDTILKKLQAVTAEQIREVTKKYFIDDSLTVAVLDPQPLEQKQPAERPSGLRY